MRTITAMFDNRPDAEEARSELGAIGISADNVTIHDQQSVGRGDTTTTTGQSTGGLWESFKSLFTDDHDTYSEGLRRGGYLLTASVDDAQVDQAIDILDDDGTVDLDERSASWRSEGWTGGSSAMATSDQMGGTRVRSYDSDRRSDDDGFGTRDEMGDRDTTRSRY